MKFVGYDSQFVGYDEYANDIRANIDPVKLEHLEQLAKTFNENKTEIAKDFDDCKEWIQPVNYQTHTSRKIDL